MNKVYAWRFHLYAILAVPFLVLIFIPTASAQSDCGEIVYPYFLDPEGNPESDPIEDCSNPFDISPEESVATLEIRGEEVSDGDTVYIDDPHVSDLDITGTPRLDDFSYDLFRHEGEDYYDLFFANSLDHATYTIVIKDLVETNPIPVKANPMQRLLDWFMPTAHAQLESYRYELTFTLAPEPEIDPLIEEYAPILYMHPDEDYFPMQVEEFIEDSALWDQSGSDAQLYSAEDLTVDTFNDVVSNEDTEDYYLAYSDPDNSKSFNLDNAKDKYGEPDPDDVTVYTHRMTDSHEGEEFIVLQYWFFYAMNNWKEHDGFNNHEGDWESVFIFLDPETEEPEYVAFSAHRNDGSPNPFKLQYDSVRREWNSDEVTRDSGQLVNFVSLGSHANYPNNGANGEHWAGSAYDLTSTTGDRLNSYEIKDADREVWFAYEGSWGTSGLLPGSNGPLGPNYIEVSGHLRFHNPIEWAGISEIEEIEISQPTTEVSAPDAGVSMSFAKLLDTGTDFLISPHLEPISFGSIPEAIELLPKFWDIESSLLNGDFSAEVSFSYDPAVVEEMEGEEENLNVFFYDPESDSWIEQISDVDTDDGTVSFNTNHFSRYALGLTEPKTLEELLDALKQEIADADLRRPQEKILLGNVRLIEKFTNRERSPFNRVATNMIDKLDRKLVLYKRKGHLSEEKVTSINKLTQKIEEKL